MRGLTSILDTVSQLLPPQAMAAVAAVLVILIAPLWFGSMRQKQIRGVIRRLVRADDSERATLHARIRHLAARSPTRWVTVVQQAIRYDQRALRDEGMQWLADDGRRPRELAAFNDTIQPSKPAFRDAFEATVRVERLLRAELPAAAREEWERAVAAFPNDAELAHLGTRLR